MQSQEEEEDENISPDSASKMNKQSYMSAQISIKNNSTAKPTLVHEKVLIGKVPSFPAFEILEEEELDGWQTGQH